MTTVSVPRKIWEPQNVSETNLWKFRNYVNKKRSLNLQTYKDLHSFSVRPDTAEAFWIDLFIFVQMRASTTPKRIFEGLYDDLMFPPPRWFPEVRMNFTENLLFGKRHSKDVAIHAFTEGGTERSTVTWNQLWRHVERVADALTSAGVVEGDRVAAIMSNRSETIYICLAAISLGAIFSSSSPDMGPKGISSRLEQIKPKLIFAENSSTYNGKRRDYMPNHRQWTDELARIPEFVHTVIITDSRDVQILAKDRMVTWNAFLNDNFSGRKLTFKQLPFNHPGFIVYSSGTGMLLQVKKDYMLSIDIRSEDTLLQYTTTGWIMWALALCGLSFGASIVVYDGSPLQPDPLVLLKIASELRISIFGTSARYLTDLKTSGKSPRNSLDLSSLRVVTSTGSVLTAEVAEWFYNVGFPKNVHLVSSSGGTDIACSFVTGDPTSPLLAGEIQAEALGMAVDIVDVNASEPTSIKRSGEPGELVCRAPFPSEPVAFWGEGGMKRYESTYYGRFGPKVWYQGDFVSIDPKTGGIMMLGRSDGVLNPSGVRFGSAEIYNVLNSTRFPDFSDTVCVGMRRPKDSDETVVLFIKMSSGHLSTSRKQDVKKAILTALSPRHVPKYIFQIEDIPYTINGKKIEFAIKQIISGQKVVASGSVANPECLKHYAKFFHIEELEENENNVTSKL